MPDSSNRILTFNFMMLFIGNFIIVSVYFLLMTTMAYYAVNAYGVDSAIAGLTASIFLVGGVTGRVVCGRFARRFGPKRLGVFAMMLQLAMVALYLVNGLSIEVLIVVRFIHGLSFGISNTVLPALAIDGLPPTRLGEGTGYYMLSNSLGVGVGPLMSILVVMGFDYRLLFTICLGLSAVALATTLLAKDPSRTAAKKPSGSASVVATEETVASTFGATTSAASASAASASGTTTSVAAVTEPACVPAPREHGLASVFDLSTFKFSVFMFIVAFAYSSLNAFINSYAIDLGMGVFAPFVFLVYSITLVISRPITGRLQDRYGENSVLYPSIASMAVGLVLAAFANNPVMLLACGIFMATGFGTCMSVGQAAAIKLSTCRDASRTISTFFLLCDSGCGIGPFMLGFIVSGAGYPAMYLICAAIAVCAVVYYHFVHGRKQISGNAER